jgi:iron complex transport system substrate-binding protein
MYGGAGTAYPARIVCLSADTTEIAFALGAGDRVVGVSGVATRPPEARQRPKVGGFTTFRVDRIRALEPDLVLASSDLQADVVRDLVRAGLPVLALNQRSLADVFQAILVVGGALGCPAEARGLVTDMQDELRQVREFSSVWPDRPRVYFEEWDDPMIAGIRWVSELIEVAGGQDVFPELRERPDARARIVDPQGPPGHRRLLVRQARRPRRHPPAPRLGVGRGGPRRPAPRPPRRGHPGSRALSPERAAGPPRDRPGLRRRFERDLRETTVND